MNRAALTAMTVLLLLGGVALDASAVQRTFVASYGLDTNPCSVISPCRSFTRALTQTDAGGEVLVLDSAGYGTFTVTQSVSVIAPEGVYAGISVFPGQDGIVLNGASIRVTLRGLTINGQGGEHGIRIVDAGEVFLERLTLANNGNDALDAGIFIMGGSAIVISDSVIRSSFGTGITIVGGAPQLFVKDTRITLSGGNGILAQDGVLTLSRVTVEKNTLDGLQIVPPSSTTVRAAVRDSEFSGNTGFGVRLLPQVTGAVAEATIERSSALRNAQPGFGVNTNSGGGTGVMRIIGSVSSNPDSVGVASFGLGATVFLSGSTVTGNSAGLSQSLGVINSCSDNKVFGNVTTSSPATVTCTQ